MLVNLSNHPVQGVWDIETNQYLNPWSCEQRGAAEQQFGCIVDLQFPIIPAEYDLNETQALAYKYLELCKKSLPTPTQNDAVFLMGELVFCSILSRLLLNEGIRVVSATTARCNVDLGNGVSRKTFKFVSFRDYGLPICSERWM